MTNPITKPCLRCGKDAVVLMRAIGGHIFALRCTSCGNIARARTCAGCGKLITRHDGRWCSDACEVRGITGRLGS
jgi:uncharacterized Zn finger protein